MGADRDWEWWGCSYGVCGDKGFHVSSMTAESRGQDILHALADRVGPEGLAVQVLSGYEASAVVRWLARLRYAFHPANWQPNLVRHSPLFEPVMPLHVYDLAAVKSNLEPGGFVCSQVGEPFAGFYSTLTYA